MVRRSRDSGSPGGTVRDSQLQRGQQEPQWDSLVQWGQQEQLTQAGHLLPSITVKTTAFILMTLRTHQTNLVIAN